MLSVLTVLAACVGLCAPSALADDDGVDWRIEDMGVRGAWSAGVTGEGVTVAVIDDQVVADHPSLEGVDVEYRLALKEGASCRDVHDSSRVMSKPGDVTLSTSDGFYNTHATGMVGLIAGNGKGYDGGMGFQGIAPGVHVVAYPNGFANKGTISGLTGDMCVNEEGSSSGLGDAALADAVDSGARVVNMSYGRMAGMWQYLPVALHAIRHGVVLVRGRGNDTRAGLYDLVGQPAYDYYFPGSVTVNSMARDGSISEYSDVMDGNVSILSPGVGVPVHKDVDTDSREVVLSEGGTSSAAADLTGYLALVFQKWPEATGNQVLQSLVRNTRDNGSGEARLDPEHKRGFGAVDPEKLLAVDPTVYPDVNPLLEWAVKASGKHEETKGLYEHHDGWTDSKGGLSDPFSPDGDRIECTSSCELIGKEYERERKAWERVEQCREDGGSDCMKYSATATADEADREAGWDGRVGWAAGHGDSKGLPSWFAPVVVGGSALLVVLLAGGVVLAVALARRSRRSGAATGSAGPVPVRGPGPVPVSPVPPRMPFARGGVPTVSSASGVPPVPGGGVHGTVGAGAPRMTGVGASQSSPSRHPGVPSVPRNPDGNLVPRPPLPPTR